MDKYLMDKILKFLLGLLLITGSYTPVKSQSIIDNYSLGTKLSSRNLSFYSDRLYDIDGFLYFHTTPNDILFRIDFFIFSQEGDQGILFYQEAMNFMDFLERKYKIAFRKMLFENQYSVEKQNVIYYVHLLQKGYKYNVIFSIAHSDYLFYVGTTKSISEILVEYQNRNSFSLNKVNTTEIIVILIFIVIITVVILTELDKKKKKKKKKKEINSGNDINLGQ